MKPMRFSVMDKRENNTIGNFSLGLEQEDFLVDSRVGI
jgi:hypothetical protein